jgi:DNA polymerase III alpha subunit (gram-positive type)
VKLETVFDLESDGLLNEVSKIHVVSYRDHTMDKPESLYTLRDWQDLFSDPNRTWVGHHIVGYDFRVLEVLHKIDVPFHKCIDTLMLSRYFYPDRGSHGLDGWGKELGIEKPKIDDWENLTREDYTFRCESDVNINWKLWMKIRSLLGDLYGYEERKDHDI